MAGKSATQPSVELDLSDVDHRVGKPVDGGQLWDPCSPSDIRRWVIAMDLTGNATIKSGDLRQLASRRLQG